MTDTDATTNDLGFDIYDVEQGTRDWSNLRAGTITASNFHLFMETLKSGPNKGGLKAAARDYAFRLAIERISGEALDEGMFQTWAMMRGIELEPEARTLHALQYDLKIEKAGFVKTNDGKFGASADGLIDAADNPGEDEDGGSEYKCFIDPAKIRTIIVDRNINEWLPQVHGGLWLTGRAWWDFCLYCPALADAGNPLICFRVERDEEYIENMEMEAIAFDQLVEEYRRQIIEVLN